MSDAKQRKIQILRSKILWSIALLLFSGNSYSALYDQSYYTHGNFEFVVNAFKRVALFYQSNMIATLIALYIGGILASSIISATKSVSNQMAGGQSNQDFISAIFLATIGLGLFSASMVPTGTMHIYDKDKNKYETVADVPAFISLTMGGLNSFVDAFRSSESTTNAYTYGEMADVSPYKIIMAAFNPAPMFPSHTISNLTDFFDDCAYTAIASGDLKRDDLRKGSYNLLTLLESAKHPALPTTIYSATNQMGSDATCSVAYESLKTELTNDATFDSALKRICHTIGLDASVASDKTICRSKMSDAFDLIYGGNTDAVGWKAGVTNMLFFEAITQSIVSGSYDQALQMSMTRNSLAEAWGIMEAGNRYIPLIKGILFTILLGTAPVILMFIVTPLIGKALKLYFGLCLFYAIWQMSDMVALTAIEDSLYATYQHIFQNKMGTLAIMQTPGAIVDGLTLIGQTRMGAITSAVLIAATLFGISAYGLAGIGQRMEGNIEEKGQQLGREMLLPENAGVAMEGMANGNAFMATLGNQGATDVVRGKAFDHTMQAKSNNLIADNLGGLNNASSAVAQSNAAKTVGTARATQAEGLPQAIQSAQIETEGNFATTTAIKNQAEDLNLTTRALQQKKTDIDAAKDQGEIKAVDKTGLHAVELAAQQNAEYNNLTALEREKWELAMGGGMPNAPSFMAMKADQDVAYEAGELMGKRIFTQEQLARQNEENVIENIQGNLTRGEVLGGTADKIRERTDALVTLDTQRNMAEAEFYQSIQGITGVSDNELAHMMAGNKLLTVDPKQTMALQEAGIISELQANTLTENGGGTIDLVATLDDQGMISPKTTAVKTGDSIDVDDAYTEKGGTNIDYAQFDFNPENARQILSDPTNLEKQIGIMQDKGASDQKVSNTIGLMALSSVTGLFDMREKDDLTVTNEVSNNAEATLSTPGKSITGSGASFSIETKNSIADSHVDERTTDEIAPHFAAVYDLYSDHFQAQVEEGKIGEEEAKRATAESLSDYYNHVFNGIMNQDHEEFNKFIFNGSLEEVFENYQGNLDLKLHGKSSNTTQDYGGTPRGGMPPRMSQGMKNR